MKPANTAGLPTFTWIVVCCSGLLAMLNGCATTDHEAPPPAVEFHWVTPGQINDAVRAVFLENGFLNAKGDYTKLVFEKKGPLLEDLAYGGWSRKGFWLRVKVTIAPAGEGICRGFCKAFRVEDRGDALEEQTELSERQTEKFNKLLQQAASRLQGSPPVTSP